MGKRVLGVESQLLWEVGGWEAEEMGGLSGKAQKPGVGLFCRLKSLPSPLIGISRGDCCSSFSGYRGGDTLTNGDPPYTCKCLLPDGSLLLGYQSRSAAFFFLNYLFESSFLK